MPPISRRTEPTPCEQVVGSVRRRVGRTAFPAANVLSGHGVRQRVRRRAGVRLVPANGTAVAVAGPPGTGWNDLTNAPAAVTLRLRPAVLERGLRCAPVARTRLYRNGVLESEDFPVADTSEHLQDPEVAVWMDFCAPTEAELAVIAEELGLHALAVEDAVHEHQRPKLDLYDSHAFLTAYAVRLDAGTGHLVTSELAAFLTPRALVTVRKDDHFDIEAVLARWNGSADLAKGGVGFLLHGLLDYVVDGHFEAVQSLDGQIEDLEESVFSEQVDNTDVQRRSLALRKSLVTLRKVVLPMREVVNTVMRRDHHFVDEQMRPYFQDVYDHVLRAGEWTESLRELVVTIRETQLNIQSNRLNLIMKKVTGWAAVIAVPTAITGFYGQNVPYPGSEQLWGFWTSATLLVVISGGLYAMFKRRDWL
jgi:magnesium transporter